jgi:small subunit ribosomal protein S8e
VLSAAITKKTRILSVMYNASNNELVRTKTLVKGAVVAVDATPFRQYYQTHYGLELGKKDAAGKKIETAVDTAGKSKHAARKIVARTKAQIVNPQFFDQFIAYVPAPAPSVLASRGCRRAADSGGGTRAQRVQETRD